MAWERRMWHPAAHGLRSGGPSRPQGAATPVLSEAPLTADELNQNSQVGGYAEKRLLE